MEEVKSVCGPITEDGDTVHALDFLEDGTCVCDCGTDPFIPKLYTVEESDEERFTREVFLDFLIDVGVAFLDDDPKYLQKLEKAYDIYCSPSDSRDGAPLRELVEDSVASKAWNRVITKKLTQTN
jgi:hypothetical protein